MAYNFSSGSISHDGSFTADGDIGAKSSDLSGSTLSVPASAISIAGVSQSRSILNNCF